MTQPTLTNKTVIITGGTSALGQAFVMQALEAGARVFFTYYQNRKVAEELAAAGAHAILLDLADTAAIDEFAKAFRQEEEGLDVLIHNAAAVRDGLLGDLTEEDWDHVLNVDLKAPYYLTKKLLSCLFKRKPSRVFMITSRTALCGAYGASNYAAAKAGLIGLVKSLAREVGRKKVLVNAVNPGFMKSGMTIDLPEKIQDYQKKQSPLSEISDPEEVARFLVFLSSNAMSQVTGQVFHFESRHMSMGC